MMQMRSLDEVLAFSDRFVRIIGGTCELDIRPVAEAEDLDAARKKATSD